MNIYITSNGIPLNRMASALASIGFTVLLAGCGGSDSSAPPAPPPSPTVSIDVFGARGTTLTAVVNSTNCSATPTVSWQASSGVALGTGTSVQDTQPNSTVTATASCSTATASQTLQANSVYSALAAFAVTQNGTAYAWGNPVWGGQNASSSVITGIAQLFPSDRGFAALLTDGTVKVWGSSFVSPTTATSALTNIASIIPGRVAFFGVKKDGSFTAWGTYRGVLSGVDVPFNDPNYGLNAATIASLTNIKSIASTEGAYAAVKADGTVVAFGDADTGGDASSVQSQLTNVTQVVGTNYDFVALRKDGTVVSWTGSFGWAIPTSDQVVTNVKNLTAGGAIAVATTNAGVTFGFGYANDVEAVDTRILNSNGILTNITNVYSTQTAFAALRADGTVVSWGDLPRMQASLTTAQASLNKVKSIQSTEYAFAALKADGTVVSWGDPSVGGDSSAVTAQLTNVVSVTANKYAFAALKADGTVVTWGMPSKGGDSSAVTAKLVNVRAIYATPFGAFLAVSKDGTFTSWGDQWAGGGAAPALLTKIPFSS